jgi:ribosomal protein S18 acetylase RimI-like enzyme
MLPGMAATVQVRRLAPDDWHVWRDIRLTALAQAPYAYGSSLAREREFGEATWRARLARESGMSAMALTNADAVGIIAGWTPEWTDVVFLVALWVDPAARGRGAGDALVTEVVDWATERGYPRVELRVADGNVAARRLFLRNGFIPTGEREPLESDPSVGTELLIRKVS